MRSYKCLTAVTGEPPEPELTHVMFTSSIELHLDRLAKVCSMMERHSESMFFPCDFTCPHERKAATTLNREKHTETINNSMYTLIL